MGAAYIPEELAGFFVQDNEEDDVVTDNIGKEDTDDSGTGVGSANTRRGGNWKPSELEPGERPRPSADWDAEEWMDNLRN